MHLMVNRESLSCMLQSNSDITLLNTIRYTGCNFTLQSICSINLPLEIFYQYIKNVSLYIDKESFFIY